MRRPIGGQVTGSGATPYRPDHDHLHGPAGCRQVETMSVSSGIPAVLLCAGIAFAIFYPLDREQHAEVRRAIADRQAQRREEAV